MQTKVLSVIQQYIGIGKTPLSIKEREENSPVPFMLKSMRLEYIFEFFGKKLTYQLANP